MLVVPQAENWRRIPSHTYEPSLSWLTLYKGTNIVTGRWKCFLRCLASYAFVPPTVFTGVVCPCLPDGDKLSQLFTNSLSSSLHSPPLQDHSLFKQYATKLNVSHMFQMLQKSPHSTYLAQKRGWEEGRGHATLFSFQRSLAARLIKPGFHKKVGSFGAGAESWCVSERKAAGRILSASSHWFSRVGVNQTQPPELTPKLPQLSSLCMSPLLQIPDSF